MKKTVLTLPLLFLSLLFSACISVRIPVGGSRVKVKQTATAIGIGALQDAAIEAALGRIRTAGDENLNRLPTFGDHLIVTHVAKDAVWDFQRRLLDEFQGPQYAGIRSELQAGVGGREIANRLSVRQTPQGEGVARNSVDSLFATLLDYVRNLTKRPDKRVTFRVETEPKQATFRICPQYVSVSEQCYALTTDGEVASLLRGYYTYDIELTGYKPVKINLDLVPFAKTRLRCILRRSDDPRDAGPCTPE